MLVTVRELTRSAPTDTLHLALLPDVSFSSYDGIYRRRDPCSAGAGQAGGRHLLPFLIGSYRHAENSTLFAYVQLKPRTPDEGLVPRSKPGPIETSCR